MKHPLLQLIIAHIKEYLREPGALFWSFGFPILMAIGLGLAFSGKKELVHSVAVIPAYNSFDSLISKRLFHGTELQDTMIEMQFTSDYGNTKYIFYITSWENASLKMKKGLVSSIITIENKEVIFHSDPLNPEAELIGIQLDRYFKTGSLGSFEGRLQPIDDKGLRYIDFLIPGLLGLDIMMSVMWGICYVLIEKRSKKLLRRMVATPMKKSHFLLAHWASRIMMMAFETFVLLLFSKYFFHIEIKGSVVALIIILLTGNFCFFGISIVISSRTSNMQLGNGLISLITSPMMVLSGIFFSYQNFPQWAVKVIKALPLTQLVDALRSVINEGAGIVDIMSNIIILFIIGIVCFIFGLKIYKWY